MVKRFLISAFLTMFIISFASISYASETEVLMNMLLNKGVITQADYDEVMGDVGEAKEKKDGEWKKHVDQHITHKTGPSLANGLNIAAGITMVGQGTSGNDKNIPPGEDVIDGSISVDLEVSAPMGDHGEVFMHLQAGDGDGIEGDEVVSLWGVNADAANSGASVSLSEAWYEHMFSNDTVVFTIGKVDPAAYFDGNEVANSETDQFLSNGFVNSIVLELPPDYSPGARLTVSPNELIDLSVGWMSGDADYEDIFDDAFLIAQVDVKPQISGRQGNYRFYMWRNQTDHTELKNALNDNESGTGWGISADQEVVDHVKLFARIGYQDKTLYPVSVAWSGGLSLNGALWGRDDDTIGIAYGRAVLSGDNEDVLRAASINPGDEGHYEAYYNLVVNEYLAISPDIQVVTNAGGDSDYETLWLGALRGQFTF